MSEHLFISCGEVRAHIAFYLDDELHGDEQAAFERHLRDCVPCRGALAGERRFLEGVRAARPLYAPDPELRARVEETLQGDAHPRAAGAFRRLAGALGLGGTRRLAVLAAALLLVAVAAGFWLLGGRGLPVRPSDFALMAVDTHLRYLRGQLPFEVASASPEEISGWFAGKVSFRLKLPNYQESSGQEKLYTLKGARLVAFRNDYAAYVAYEMRGRPISLVVTSNNVAMPSGGEEIVSKGLRFHYDAVDGLKVITWADRGLTYALVSDLEERGQQSCVVCHAGTKDQDFIERLKP